MKKLNLRRTDILGSWQTHPALAYLEMGILKRRFGRLLKDEESKAGFEPTGNDVVGHE